MRKPARYTGGEYNEVVKERADVRLRIALCCPATYDIGMSNLGFKILYGLANSMDGVWCERVFAPWDDMADAMRGAGVGLYGLESGDPIRDFDIIAFSIGYEMAYTNVLDMLDLAGLPVRAADRGGDMPLVIAGGTCCYNPEPLADFIDLFIIGEGEDVNGEVFSAYMSSRDEGGTRDGFLKKASRLGGVYVPSLYGVAYGTDGTVSDISPLGGAPMPVVKRIARELDAAYFPERAIVPSTEIVHDRVSLEVFRGCIRGCRFCQAGYVYRPVRPRSASTAARLGLDALADSGYDELSVLSLSTSDYRGLTDLTRELLDWCEPRRVSLSLPSLRADNFSVELMGSVRKVRRSGLTFAPEAGSQRLRDVINKNVTRDDVLGACRTAFEGGWSAVKLYFMLGLPTETDEDVLAIAELTHQILSTWRGSAVNKSRGVRITVSTSCFIPKPHTPFQWEPQIAADEYRRRVGLLRDAMRTRSIVYNWHSPETGLVEAALSRGDRRLGRVLEQVWRDGARLDAWDEHFSFERWMDAFGKCGLDPAFFANRERARGELLPWSVVSAGVSGEYLWSEREAARAGAVTPDCRAKCTGCGASALIAPITCDMEVG
ncbi:MAG: TIGR03960 family B12-binding radical SAM protein [Oscillospiraceae bacterium]|nr:TIGR03960 family B12-binding radical SAM protein [Oscillospiraceae bacterium]